MSTRKQTSAPLSSAHEIAWRHYLRANALLTRALDTRLREAHGISLVLYDTLVQLSEAPGQRLYMKDLADALVYSASGMTRLVDNLERQQLVRRQVDPVNRRATLVVLTTVGKEALDSAWPTHLHSVQDLWAQYLTTKDAEQLGKIFSRIRGGLEATPS